MPQKSLLLFERCHWHNKHLLTDAYLQVIELIRAAADPTKQMSMPALWHPWA